MRNATNGFNKIRRCVGRNLGTIVIAGMGPGYELALVKQLWPHVKLIAVEMNPITIAIAKRRGRLSHIDHFFHTALWSDVRDVEFCLSGESSCILEAQDINVPEPCTIRSMTLDILREQSQPWPEPILLWLDCEGSERYILPAMSYKPKFINLEMGITRILPNMWSALELWNYMTSINYEAIIGHSFSRFGIGMDMLFRYIENKDMSKAVKRTEQKHTKSHLNYMKLLK